VAAPGRWAPIMRHAHPLLALLSLLSLLALSLPAAAQFRCRAPDGSISFQQNPCPNGHGQQKLDMRVDQPAAAATSPDYSSPLSELERQRKVREAIMAGRPMVSMTRAELDSAMGSPLRSSSGQVGPDSTDQLYYQRGGRGFYVSLRNGLVVAFDDVDPLPARAAQAGKPCPSAREIRDIEIDISKLANRDNKPLQLELNKRLLDARACR